MKEWIQTLFEIKELLRMGHHQRAEDANLGLGWLYYALARIIRPAKVVVIGSFRGFVPLIFSKALVDNAEGGQVWFIDPSLVDDFWKEPSAVQKFFGSFGATNIEHFLLTTQQFVKCEKYRSLGEVGIVFVDGYHSEEQARFDYEAFQDHLSAEGIVLFHDSVRVRTSRMYGPERHYEHRVKCFVDTLKNNSSLQVFDLPFGDGITLVRRAENALSSPVPDGASPA
jgi:predicted O-methyltransferase YrrM